MALESMSAPAGVDEPRRDWPYFGTADGTLSPIPVPAGTWAVNAGDINASGQLVGGLIDQRFGRQPFLYQDGRVVLLKDAVTLPSGWTLTEATAINDAGVIVGYGVKQSVAIRSRPCLLVPAGCPAPSPTPGTGPAPPSGLSFSLAI
ncbi:MAG: hypothetical protein AB7N90_12255, partial [Vicinamibacterales bacterium]